MGCGPSQDTAPAGGAKELVIYGDYYSADTCALLAILEKCET